MKEQIILFRTVSIICALSIMQLLAGCSAQFKSVEYTYELTLIDNEVMVIENAQYYESNNNKIPYVLYEFLENDYVNDLEYNLISLSDYSISSIDLNVSDNYRVLSLVALDENCYVYTMVDQPNPNPSGLFHYQVVRQSAATKEIITEGYTSLVFDAPMLSVFENNAYFLLSSLDYSKNYSKGDYRIEFWKVNCDEASMLSQSIGKYEDYYLDNNTEYHFQRKPNVSDSAVSFLSKKGNNMYLNRFIDGTTQKIALNDNYNYAIPIDKNGYLCGKISTISEGIDKVETFYFDCKENEYIEVQLSIFFADWISLSNGIVVGIDNNGIGWFLRVNKENVDIEKLTINNPIYFRRLSDKEVLIFASDNGWKTYKLSLVHPKSS